MAYGGRLIRKIGSSLLKNETNSSTDDPLTKDALSDVNNTATQWTGTKLLSELIETVQGRY